MRFRPCIDIHNGKVKQIVGSSLRDEDDSARENFVAERDAAWYAGLFREDGLTGGHVILLNGRESPFYEQTRAEALAALAAWPGGLQLGGGIRAENAAAFLDAGASHVIVTSYVFFDGRIDFGNLEKLEKEVGRERLVLDLSCRRRDRGTAEAGEVREPGEVREAGDDRLYICTDRWQKFTETALDAALLSELAPHCAEFLVHAIAAEGKGSGIDGGLAAILAGSPIPVTYAGGIHSFADIEELGRLGRGRVDYTVGSALDLYGGTLAYRELAARSGSV